MPPDTRIRDLLRAARDRTTKTTKVLDKLFAAPGKYDGKAVGKALEKPGALDGEDFLAWATSHLQQPGQKDPTLVLSPNELDHIADWPDAEKEKVRAALDTAIKNGRKVKFEWEIYGGQTSTTRVKKPTSGTITVTFSTPEAKVRSTGVPDEVTIDVP